MCRMTKQFGKFDSEELRIPLMSILGSKMKVRLSIG
jgi:hypothetical protein